MKNLFKHALLYSTVLGLGFIYSCSEDPIEEPAAAPSISVSYSVEDAATATTAYAGDTIFYTISVDAPGTFNTLYIKLNGSTSQLNKNEGLEDLTESEFLSFQRSYYSIATGAVGTTLAYSFIVVDDASQTDTATFSVEIVDYPVDEFTTILLGGQVNTTKGSYYDATGNTVYLTAGARDNNAKIDLLYYYVTTAGIGAVIASPDNAEAQITFETNSVSWPFTTVENQTRFKPTSNGFVYADAVSATDIENAFSEVGAGDSRITDLQVGQVVAFQLDATKNSKYGIFEVVAITGTAGSDRAIEINVKVQK